MAPKKKEGSPATCQQECICYVLSCDRCHVGGVSARYYGESARTPYLCGREHLRGQAACRDENPLWKHDSVHHLGVKGTYSMRVLRRHKVPLSRQLHEATEIELSTDKIIMNSKGEYNGVKVPRVTIEVGNRVLIKDFRGQEQQNPGYIVDQVRLWELNRRSKPTEITGSQKRRGAAGCTTLRTSMPAARPPPQKRPRYCATPKDCRDMTAGRR